MQPQTNNKFYLFSYQTGITNERKLCDIFNRNFSVYGFSIRQLTDTFGNFDAEIFFKDKSILKVEIKTRADKFFNESGFIYNSIFLNKSKVNQTDAPETLFIFGNQNYTHIYFYFNIRRCEFLNYSAGNQGRHDRTEKKLCYEIPLADCISGWNNFLNFLCDLINQRINKDFSTQNIFKINQSYFDFNKNYTTADIPF
ncbi:MAG TPA: hypothetical protein PKY81_15700 [bacterium]|nr:hypothetical protein [bacterium]